ncbi:unnamed protein product [Caenorhabditis brenneri]
MIKIVFPILFPITLTYSYVKHVPTPEDLCTFERIRWETCYEASMTYKSEERPQDPKEMLSFTIERSKGALQCFDKNSTCKGTTRLQLFMHQTQLFLAENIIGIECDGKDQKFNELCPPQQTDTFVSCIKTYLNEKSSCSSDEKKALIRGYSAQNDLLLITNSMGNDESAENNFEKIFDSAKYD